jgi:hypothetical protein
VLNPLRVHSSAQKRPASPPPTMRTVGLASALFMIILEVDVRSCLLPETISVSISKIRKLFVSPLKPWKFFNSGVSFLCFHLTILPPGSRVSRTTFPTHDRIETHTAWLHRQGYYDHQVQPGLYYSGTNVESKSFDCYFVRRCWKSRPKTTVNHCG